MSQYVVIKKGGVILLEYCRSSRVYEAINKTSSLPFDSFEEFTADKLTPAITYLQRVEEQFIKGIAQEREKLPFCKNKKDIDECFADINEFQDEIDELDQSINTLRCLKDFLEEKDEDCKPYKLEWGIM